MADLYLTPAEKYTAALGGFYYGNLPEPGTVYTQLIKDILDGSTPDKEPKNILARFIYSLYISDLGDPYPRYELAKLLYWKLHNITPTKSGSILTVTIDGKEDYMTINTDLSRLWYKVLFGSKTDVITEFPYIFNTMQNKLSDWELFGNTVQNGTPTPDNPVMPQGTGERTGNLVRFYQEEMQGSFYGVDVTVKNAEITLNGTVTIGSGHWVEIGYKFGGGTDSTDNVVIPCEPETPYTIATEILDGNSTQVRIIVFGTSNENRTVNIGSSLTTTFSGDINRIFISLGAGGVVFNNLKFRVMFNKGSAPLPYEPYGIKIPISSAGQTTPVYLGEVQSTRRIKKVVLTGEENWRYSTSSRVHWIENVPNDYDNTLMSRITTICTHYKCIQNNTGLTGMTNGDLRLYAKNVSPVAHELYIKDETYTSAADFKAYLAQQYATGTPVTVWYVLATEETAVVNEPLMKIGEYADSVSRTQTGIDIPTVIGQNTLDVLTTVKPSSMSIEYTSADENRSRSKRISLLKSPLKKRLIK